MQLRQALVLPLELEPELELPASIYLTSLRSMCMPAAHECARKILVFVITFTRFLCKHKFDIFLVWGAGVRRSCKSMASSFLKKTGYRQKSV